MKKVLLFGGLLMDRYIVTGRYPRRGEDTLIREEFQRVGGCPFNVAKTLQNLGVEPVIWSALSDDPMGRELRAVLAAEGMSSRAVYPLPGEKTGYCMVVLDREGERTFFTYRGCEGHFDPGRADPALAEEVSAVFVTGIYLLYPGWSGLAVDFLEQLAARGLPVLFDPGPLLGEMDPALLRRMLDLSAILTPNTAEREQIEKALDIPDLPGWGLHHGMRCVLETRGERGAVLYLPEGAVELPPCPARVVDTTGTGDSFAGGLLAGLLCHGDLVRAAREASACGALTAEALGAHRAFGWEEVRARAAQAAATCAAADSPPAGR